MKRCKLIILAACLLSVHFMKAQGPKIKFGNISPKDFEPTVYAVDSSASAVVLADIGTSYFEGNNKNSVSLFFKNFRRVHILNKNGYDIATVEIYLYTSDGVDEELEGLKAVTYNLENGKVVETKLDIKTALFKEQVNKNFILRKFTFPNIKAGSIIEYEYTQKSEYIFNLQPWNFQGDYPRLWSEYTVKMPQFFNYVTLVQGYNTYFIKEQKQTRETYFIADSRSIGSTERVSFSANVTEFRWAMKDVPPLKIEGFTSTLKNHISRIEFQLQSQQEPFTPRSIMNTWPVVAKGLLERDDFGMQLIRDNSWLKDVMSEAINDAADQMTKARNIYAWVRDNITCTNHNGRYIEQSLKNVLKSRKGSVAEVNMLLIAMLRKAGISADPVLLGTKSHGYTHTIYPLMDRFNYVICRMLDGERAIYLDASEPGMGFGILSYECYNGHARVIDENATAIELNPDELKESKSTTVFIINDEKANSIGSFTQVPGTYESYFIRKQIKEKGKDNFIKDVNKVIGTEIEITANRIDSVNKYDYPVAYNLEFNWNPEKAEVLYFNPMFGEGYKENPFKSARRLYPVEMPYTKDEIFTLQMEIPAGYVIDELPKQAIVKFNEEGDAMFEYRISSSGGSITFRSRLVIKRTYFAPDEYESLREFFSFIVKKHNEQVVFKKKANP